MFVKTTKETIMVARETGEVFNEGRDGQTRMVDQVGNRRLDVKIPWDDQPPIVLQLPMPGEEIITPGPSPLLGCIEERVRPRRMIKYLLQSGERMIRLFKQ